MPREDSMNSLNSNAGTFVQTITGKTFDLSNKNSINEKPQQLKESSSSEEPTIDLLPYLKEPEYTLKDVILAEKTKASIQKMQGEFKHQHLIFYQWGMRKKHKLDTSLSISFAGVPGVGKTLAAIAIAYDFGKKILIVPSYKLRSKFRGVTEKNIVKAFEVATENDAVLFFDEAEDFLGERLDNVTQSTDAAYNSERTVMLTQLSEYEGTVIFATNKIKNYDSAILSRIRWQIQFDLPDEKARIQIWEKQFPVELPLDESVDCQQLAKDFDGISGRDIKKAVFQAVVSAAMEEVPEEEKRVKQSHLVEAIIQILEAKEAAKKKELTLKPVEGEVPLPDEIKEVIEDKEQDDERDGNDS